MRKLLACPTTPEARLAHYLDIGYHSFHDSKFEDALKAGLNAKALLDSFEHNGRLRTGYESALQLLLGVYEELGYHDDSVSILTELRLTLSDPADRILNYLTQSKIQLDCSDYDAAMLSLMNAEALISLEDPNEHTLLVLHQIALVGEKQRDLDTAVEYHIKLSRITTEDTEPTGVKRLFYALNLAIQGHRPDLAKTCVDHLNTEWTASLTDQERHYLRFLDWLTQKETPMGPSFGLTRDVLAGISDPSEKRELLFSMGQDFIKAKRWDYSQLFFETFELEFSTCQDLPERRAWDHMKVFSAFMSRDIPRCRRVLSDATAWVSHAFPDQRNPILIEQATVCLAYQMEDLAFEQLRQITDDYYTPELAVLYLKMASQEDGDRFFQSRIARPGWITGLSDTDQNAFYLAYMQRLASRLAGLSQSRGSDTAVHRLLDQIDRDIPVTHHHSLVPYTKVIMFTGTVYKNLSDYDSQRNKHASSIVRVLDLLGHESLAGERALASTLLIEALRLEPDREIAPTLARPLGLIRPSGDLFGVMNQIVSIMIEYFKHRFYPYFQAHIQEIRSSVGAVSIASLYAGFSRIQFGVTECRLLVSSLEARIQILDQDKSTYAVLDGTGSSGRPKVKAAILYIPNQDLPFEIETSSKRYVSLGAAILSLVTPEAACRAIVHVANTLNTDKYGEFCHALLAQFLNGFVEFPNFIDTLGTSMLHQTAPIKTLMAPFERLVNDYVLKPTQFTGTRPKYCQDLQFYYTFPLRSSTGIYPPPIHEMGPIGRLVRDHGGKITAVCLIATWIIAGPMVVLPIIALKAATYIVESVEEALGIHPDRAYLSKLLQFAYPLLSPQNALIMTAIFTGTSLLIRCIPNTALSEDLQHLFGYFCQYGLPIMYAFGPPKLFKSIAKLDKELTDSVLMPVARFVDKKVLTPITHVLKIDQNKWIYKNIRPR